MSNAHSWRRCWRAVAVSSARAGCQAAPARITVSATIWIAAALPTMVDPERVVAATPLTKPINLQFRRTSLFQAAQQ